LYCNIAIIKARAEDVKSTSNWKVVQLAFNEFIKLIDARAVTFDP
jgi:hypothetical protein